MRRQLVALRQLLQSTQLLAFDSEREAAGQPIDRYDTLIATIVLR